MIKSSNKPKIMLALGQPYCLATDIRDGLFYRVFFLSQSRTKRNLNKQANNSIINGPVYPVYQFTTKHSFFHLALPMDWFCSVFFWDPFFPSLL